MARKVIQIATSISMAASDGQSDETETVIALCDDGTMWDLGRWYDKEKGPQAGWTPIPNVPQGEQNDGNE